MNRSAAQVLVKSLENHGVTHVFGVPGEENLAFLEALRTSKITFVVTRHEQSAVFMAATIGRLTGKVGVALATLGPGATNMMTGVAYAQLGGMPVLVITGQKPLKKSKQGKFQIVDIVRMMEPVTKFSERIASADRTASLVHEAITKAESERPGAVHLELPEDIAEDTTDVEPILIKKLRRPLADTKALTEAKTRIESADRPLIILAAGANRTLVHKQLHNFLEKTQIPFVTTQMGKGIENEYSPLYLGTTALSKGDYVHKAIEKSDCIIMIGHDTREKPPAIFTQDKTVIHINFSPAENDLVYMPTLEVIGDIANTVWQLGELIAPQPHWQFDSLFEIKTLFQNSLTKEDYSESFPTRPEYIAQILEKIVPKESIVSLDNGMYKIWLTRNYRAQTPNSLLLDNALATMGAGLAAGMAAKILNRDKKVIVVAGDGGFLMNIAELETAVRLKLDLVVLLLNDNGYGMISWKQGDMHLPNFGLSFGNPDFAKLAESFGAHGHTVADTKDLETILTKALNSTGVHIINCPIDYSHNNARLGVLLDEATKNI